MITIGQYLQPSNGHLPVQRYKYTGYLQMFENRPTQWASNTLQ